MGRPKKGTEAPKPPRKMWAFRPTPEALAFVQETSVRDRLTKSAVAVDCIEGTRDIRAVLGDDWYEVERQARVENVSRGEMIGRLAKTALEKSRKR